MSASVRPLPRGRPRQDSLAARQARLLDTAAALFLEHGYGATTLEAVVAAAGISKRTLYQRYADKDALFAAVLEHVIAGLRPPADVPLVKGDSLAEVLERLAGFMLQAAIQPQALALHRLLTAECVRFPVIGRLLAADGNFQLGTGLVAGLLLEAATPSGELPALARLPPERAQLLAAQFLNLVVGHPQHAASGLAPPMSADQLRAWPRDCVRLFLHGVRGGS